MIDKVAALIKRLSPAPICDQCIVDRLQLAAVHQARLRTSELAGQGDYERSTADCAICGDVKVTIRRIGR